MRPRRNPSLPPAFHELDHYTFQNSCCDLFAEEESVASCVQIASEEQTAFADPDEARPHEPKLICSLGLQAPKGTCP